MRANPLASGDAGAVSMAGGGGRRRWFAGALLGAAALSWPGGAAAAIVFDDVCLLNQAAYVAENKCAGADTRKVEEPTLLMNPNANNTTYELPLFRLYVTAHGDNSSPDSSRHWYYTKLTFTNTDDTSITASVCTNTDDFKPGQLGAGVWAIFNLFSSNSDASTSNSFLPAARKAIESLSAGDYKLSIQAFSNSTCTTSTSEIKEVGGTLVLKPFMEIIAADVNGAAAAYLQPGEKFDVNFTLRNNRTAAHIVGANGDAHPLDSAGVEMVEWLVATTPPPSSANNHATGMSCSALPSDKDKTDISGQFSTTLPKSASAPAAVPANAAFGVYNLYLRAHAATSCSGTGEISPVYVLKDAIVVASQVLSIKVNSSLPPLLAVGKNDVDVVWTVTFSHAMTGVDAEDFRLVASGASGAYIVSASGSERVYSVTARIPAGALAPDQLGSLRLDFVDNDTVKSTTNYPIGGLGPGNGDFNGETQALQGSICGAADVIWCDDFERSTQGSGKADLVGNGWVATVDTTYCKYTPSTRTPDAGGCAGIDSDIKPYHDRAKPRANGSRSMFNRWDAHTVTSPVIDLSGLSAAGAAVELSYWVRRGDDVFAEDPDATHDYFRAEYLGKDGGWHVLAAYRSTLGHGVAGEALRPVFQLPDAALWSGFRIRFSQMGGAGYAGENGANKVNGFDYWFVDDVALRRVSAPRYTGGFCDNFEAPEASRRQWSFGHEYEDVNEGETWHWGGAGTSSAGSMRIGDAGVTGDVYPTDGSATHSMFLRWSYVAASSLRIDTSELEEVAVNYVMQRGMKNPPSKINGASVLTSCHATTSNTGNDFVSEYYGSDGAWHRLQTVGGDNSTTICGEVFNYSAALTAAEARHKDFRLRFRQVSKGGYQTGNQYYDYWLVDDVCVGKGTEPSGADLALTKRRAGADLTPGGVGEYVLRVTNNGPGMMLGNVWVTDTLPAGLSFLGYQGELWSCAEAGQVVTCYWSGLLEKGNSAPELHIYAKVAETASGALTNTATLSSDAAEVDESPGNNAASDTSVVNTVSFLFTKGACADGETVGGVEAAEACSRYRFGGVAGETKSNIHITHVSGAGVARALSDSEATAMMLQFALRCFDPEGGTVQALFGASAAPLLSLNVCAGSEDEALLWSSNFLGVTFPVGAATANGVYGFRYEDVGRMGLYVRTTDDGRQGGGDAFVQKPAALVLAEVTCADSTDNPAAAGANGARFCRAGQAFGLAVEARSANGKPTPNFGHEAERQGVFLEKVLLAPADGHDPELAVPGLDDFVDGRASITAQSWTEVGIIRLTPRLWSVGTPGLSTDYLGEGDVPEAGRTALLVGRFYPDHFQTEVGKAGGMACPASLGCPEGGFFYAGQPFELSVRACPYGEGTCAGLLENYQGDFAADVLLSAWGGRGAEDSQDPPGEEGCLDFFEGASSCFPAISAWDFKGGVFTGRLKYGHRDKTRPVGQAAVYFRAQESGRDGVSSLREDDPEASTEAGIAVARGRLRLFNQFGTERADLAMPVRVEFWHCNEGAGSCVWMPSATDATPIDKAAVSLHAVEGPPPVVAGFELGGGEGRIVLKPQGVGSVNVSVNLGGEATDNACNHTADGLEGTGAKVAWLRAWNGRCARAQIGEADPSARGSSGVYSGEGRRSVHSRDVP